MGSRYHIKIGGVGFLVAPGSYRRSGTDRGETRRWAVSDWRRGDGHPVTGRGGDGERGRFEVAFPSCLPVSHSPHLPL